MNAHRTALASHGIALAATAVVGIVYVLAAPLPLDTPFLLPFLVPVTLAAALGGARAGATAAVAAAIFALAFLFPRDGALLYRSDHLGMLGLFAAESALLCWLFGAVRRRMRVAGEDAVETALRESEVRYRAIVDTQAEMVCRFRPDGEILFANGGYARARGTTPDALAGRNFWDFIADEDRTAVRGMLDGLRPDAPEVRIENRFETKEGVRWTLWTNRALRFDAQGRCTEAQSTGIDITERKEAEQALREANRRQTEFLAVLGHELRNPLAPLSAGLELLQQPTIGRESIVKVRAMMKRQLDHLTRLVEDLLDMSRISRGEVVLRTASLDIRDVVDAAVELCMPAIVERRHRLVVETGRVPLPIDGDFQRLTQVMGNLLNNATKYTEPGGSITVTAGQEGEQVVVRVRDTGLGVPTERLDTLFDMFSQVPEHRELTGSGLGIGLALSRQLIVRHGGSIEAASEGLGRGSEFSVRLPVGWRVASDNRAGTKRVEESPRGQAQSAVAQRSSSTPGVPAERAP